MLGDISNNCISLIGQISLWTCISETLNHARKYTSSTHSLSTPVMYIKKKAMRLRLFATQGIYEREETVSNFDGFQRLPANSLQHAYVFRNFFSW